MECNSSNNHTESLYTQFWSNNVKSTSFLADFSVSLDEDFFLMNVLLSKYKDMSHTEFLAILSFPEKMLILWQNTWSISHLRCISRCGASSPALYFFFPPNNIILVKLNIYIYIFWRDMLDQFDLIILIYLYTYFLYTYYI